MFNLKEKKIFLTPHLNIPPYISLIILTILKIVVPAT